MGWVPLNWMSVALVAVSVFAIGWLRLNPRPVAA